MFSVFFRRSIRASIKSEELVAFMFCAAPTLIPAYGYPAVILRAGAGREYQWPEILRSASLRSRCSSMCLFLKLFINNIIHTASCFYQRCCKNSQASSFFNIAGGTEEAFGFIEGSRINSAGKRSSAGRITRL